MISKIFQLSFLLDHVKSMIILLHEKLDIALKIEKYFRMYPDTILEEKGRFYRTDRIGDQMLSQ